MSSPTNNALFDKFFLNIYQDRWEKLKHCLLQPEKQVLRVNQFAEVREVSDLEKSEFLERCYLKPEGYKLSKNHQNLFPYYIMDPASIIVAQALEVQSGDRVLDMCAAPGGKSLILAEALPDLLISNEISEGRRERLTRVFHEYIPKEKRLFITVKGLDANQYGLRMTGEFNRVLADVPCSGERHLLENNSEFTLWTEKRTKNLAVRQYSLLSSAWLSCETGGRIVYSTCSISPFENDDVIAKLVKKRKPEILRLNYLEQYPFIEKTQYGYQILPDRSGFGPMYFSVIQKI